MTRKLPFLLFVWIFAVSAIAKPTAKPPLLDSTVVYTAEDRQVFDRYISEFSDRKTLPMGDLLVATGEFFLNTPYVGYTLEIAEPEKLVINLRELDCTTFVETCLALARTLKSEEPDFERYARELRLIRYRGGVLDAYPSRLHYFSDWIFDNEQKGTVKNLTRKAGGRPFAIAAYLMSRYPKNYKQLADTNFVNQIRVFENQISTRKHYCLPKTKIDPASIKDGDILAMTTSGKSIGIMHMGFAVKRDSAVYFLHASSTGKRVMMTETPFAEYLSQIKKNMGYMIVRPQEVFPKTNRR